MNNLMKFIYSTLILVLTQFAIGQDINFDDLQRPGPALVQSKSINGLVSEGNSYMRQFSETDTARIEARRQAATSSSSSPGSSGGNVKFNKVSYKSTTFAGRPALTVTCDGSYVGDIYEKNGNWSNTNWAGDGYGVYKTKEEVVQKMGANNYSCTH